jgi:hypothetical protein
VVHSRLDTKLVNQATQNRSTLDSFMAEVCHGMGRVRWAKVAGTVLWGSKSWSSALSSSFMRRVRTR